jgi:hypothetical protein
MDLERGPLSLVSTTGEILGKKSSCSGLKIREYGRRDPLRWPRDTLSATVGTNFADKRLSLGRYSSLADKDHAVIIIIIMEAIRISSSAFDLMVITSKPPKVGL